MGCVNRVNVPSAWTKLDRNEHYQLEALCLVKVILTDGEKVGIEHDLLFDAARAIIDQKIEDVDIWGELQKIFRSPQLAAIEISVLVKQVDEISDKFVANHTHV